MKELFRVNVVELTDEQLADLKVISFAEPLPFAVSMAENEIKARYGDTVSVLTKGKSLLKFGRNDDLDPGTRETIWLNGGTETLPTTNAIDTVSSNNAGDTQDLYVEYHTVSGTGADATYTFGTQTATLNGQNKVTLTVPCARVSRMYNLGSTAFAGNIYCYEDGTVTGGVPDDNSTVHATISAGDEQTFKAATTVANTDYMIVTAVYGSVKRSTSAVIDFRFETAAPGEVFRPRFEFSGTQSAGVSFVKFDPYIIVPKNYDVRVTGETNTNNTTADAGFQAYFAQIV